MAPRTQKSRPIGHSPSWIMTCTQPGRSTRPAAHEALLAADARRPARALGFPGQVQGDDFYQDQYQRERGQLQQGHG